MAPEARFGPGVDRDPRAVETRVLEDAVSGFVEAAFAPATIRRYKGVWRSFKGFADIHRPGWSQPVGPATVALFGAWLDRVGYKPSTIGNQVRVVGWWQKIGGWEDPSKSYLVKSMLVGLREV